MNFKEFLIESEMTDVRKTLGKIPKVHKALLHGYKYKFEKGNTLDGDHVGEIDEKNKTVSLAAPWNYGREFTFLHELAHAVWKNYCSAQLRKEWSKIVKDTKAPHQHQGDEELFCMAYATTYAKNKIVIHSHPEWEKFIKRLPK